MKADARSPAEQEALKWATRFLKSAANDLTVEGGKAAWVRGIAKLPPDSQEELISEFTVAALVHGDLYAFEILGELAAERIAEGKPLSGALHAFTVLFLRHPFSRWRIFEGSVTAEKIKSKPGPRQLELSHRNNVIIQMIKLIRVEWGLPPTRNTASRDTAAHASGASIVRDALEKGANVNLTEAAVNKIWQKYSSFQRYLDQPVPDAWKSFSDAWKAGGLPIVILGVSQSSE
jgi:hypothetical protein